MNKERILLLADMIETNASPAAQPDLGFNMATYFSDEGVFHRHGAVKSGGTECGTVGCIAGWAALAFPHAYDLDWGQRGFYGRGQQALDLTDLQADLLFTPDVVMLYSEITPDHAVCVLRHFAETGEVDWDLFVN
jgi:hypothetical protein